eukprot:CAMPEP_0178436342 /NCGR_PEP_ID=MMETSP0689_2-20121128/34390_1 /TAXON_ID=160604 /ORGANISM="Amphidinium massartii, Strain CS-259" /LENGTH=283 /DNA_ID=CAMNT_0020058435 /DNA_START=216 /DNA_END=1067 /DNA_ORIENTATION=+
MLAERLPEDAARRLFIAREGETHSHQAMRWAYENVYGPHPPDSASNSNPTSLSEPSSAGDPSQTPPPSDSDEDDDDDYEEPPLLLFLDSLLAHLMAFGTRACVVGFIAWTYFDRVTKHRLEWQRENNAMNPSATEDFRTKIFGCFDNLDYACLGVWCFIPRVADTHHAVGVWPFWQTVGVLIGIDLASMLISFIIPGSGALLVMGLRAGFLTVSRGKLRAAMGKNPDVKPIDAFFWCCCPCCTAIQEAREVDRETQTTATCCCALSSKRDGLLVGDAVSSEGI